MDTGHRTADSGLGSAVASDAMHPVELIFGNEMDFFFATVYLRVSVCECVYVCVLHVNC